jgi:hypothetical protein
MEVYILKYQSRSLYEINQIKTIPFEDFNDALETGIRIALLKKFPLFKENIDLLRKNGHSQNPEWIATETNQKVWIDKIQVLNRMMDLEEVENYII